MWPRRKADRLLEEMIRENGLAETGAAPQPRRFSLFGRKRKSIPFTAEPTAKSRDRRSDLTVAALGVTLGLICALFPWYIFFNQEQFGVQAIAFGGSGRNAGRVSGGSQQENAGAPLTAKDIPEVDLFATGTLPDQSEDPDQAPGLDQQPFPADAGKFRLVHVANGRAMIEDDTGLWIVQPGSMLPDSSRVASIEHRGGKWVMVTSTDRVIELSK
jgi:hypothetical protein